MSWIITGAQPFPAVIGEPFGGGFFVGYISHTADGNPTHALIAAPRATGESTLAWKTTTTTTAGTTSTFDGSVNTAAIVTAGIADHPAAQFCVGLSIGGFSDWYLPAYYENDIFFENLKPTLDLNSTAHGINPYAVPQRNTNRTALYPLRTTNTDYIWPAANSLFDGDTWSSTQSNATNSFYTRGLTGLIGTTPKTGARRVRAFRRIAL